LGNTLPADVPAEAATAARDTLGGAVSAAGQLPGELGVDLIDAARMAFTDGLRLTAAISAVLSLGGAVLALVLLRTVPPRSESFGDADTHQMQSDSGEMRDGSVPAYD
jgi:DHA2 family multidrug resistance protein-like MFS transporter